MVHPSVILLAVVGIVLILAMLSKVGLERLGLPPLVGYILIGLAVNFVDRDFAIMDGGARTGIEFLAEAGVVVLLFRVGLEANLYDLFAQIRGASIIWLANVGLSFTFGYWATAVLLGYGPVPALFVATALSATSLGVPLAIWRNLGMLNTRIGAMLTDVAELDDISGIVLMAVILALVPVFMANGGVSPGDVAAIGFLLVAKFTGFLILCFLFAHYLEAPVMRWVMKHSPPPGPVIAVAGFGFAIAALVGMLGFSTAIGAFFAGLAFSRDPSESEIDRGFETLYTLFAPFFFIGLGLLMNLDALSAGIGIGAVLLVPAVLGKLAGGGLPAWAMIDARAGWLLGISLIPRAEIALIVMLQGMRLGADVVPTELFNGMVVVSFATAVSVPIMLQRMLRESKGSASGAVPD